MDKNQNLTELLELANHYPSPHNGQPIRAQVDNDRITLFFDKNRGLQATDISYIFSFVSMGVFVEHIKLCAQALGHSLEVELKLPKESDLKGEGLAKFAVCDIKWDTSGKDEDLIKTIQNRQTSRKKYSDGVPLQLQQKLADTAAKHKMKLVPLGEKQGHETIWLNQRAVFDDLFDEPVRKELNHWLRYNKREKQEKKDGLAYDCMELSGSMLKYIVKHPSFLRWPLISSILKHYYLRTMIDASTVFYLQAPFNNEQQSFNIGVAVMDIWITCSQQDYYIHPFGTIVSNRQAHQDFLNLTHITDESRETGYVCFIFRAGKSEPPVRSLRLAINEHLMQGQNV